MNKREEVAELIQDMRVTYKGKNGTLVSVALNGFGYFNPDTNKHGNDGMILVNLEDLAIVNK